MHSRREGFTMSTQPLWIPRVRMARQRRGLLGCLAPAIGGVVVGILLALGAIVVLGPQPHAPPPPTPASAAPAHATLTLDDAFLSRLSADGLRQANLPFTTSNVRVTIHPNDQIAIVADATAGLLTRQLDVSGSLGLAGGRLRLHVTQAAIGGLALPAPFDAALESALNAQLATLNDLFQFGGTSYAITSVATREGLLTLGLAPH